MSQNIIPLNRTCRYQNGLTLTYDPLPYEDGGYKKGTFFPAVNVRENIERGGFTDGSKFRDGKGNEYIYNQCEVMK